MNTAKRDRRSKRDYGEQALHQRFPQSRVLAYDDIPLALTALRNGNVQAITQDSTILAGLLSGAPDKADFKILPDLLSKRSAWG